MALVHMNKENLFDKVPGVQIQEQLGTAAL